MADDLTYVGEEVAFAGNVTRGHPWHRLGVEVTADMDIETAAALSKSNDWVYPTTLHDGDNDEADGYIGIKSNMYGLMHVASPGYEIMQRRELLELAYEITGLSHGAAHVDTIGNLGEHGERFFAYVRVPDLVIDPQGVMDTIERGLVVATSFNGTLPNILGYSNIRVVCANTLAMALGKGMKQAIKVKHTKFSDERIRMAAEGLQYAGAVEKKVIENAEKMLGVPGSKALDAVFKEFWPVTENLGELAKTRRENERQAVASLYNGVGNISADLVGDNGWAVYQAFTEYMDHQRTAKGRNKELVRAEAAVLPGRTVDQKIRASEVILALGA